MSARSLGQVVEQNRRAYNKLASRYAMRWVDRPDVELADEFVQLLAHDSKVLDIGCGPGHYSSYFIDKGLDVEAVDTSAEMLSLAVGRDPRLRVRSLDMSSMDYSPATFDGLWACASLPHIPRECVGDVLAGFRRILKPSGYIYVNAIIGDLDYRVESPEEMGVGETEPGRFFQWYSSSDDFRRVVESAGFRVFSSRYRSITSDVLEHATRPTNVWYGCFGQTSC